MKSEFSKRFFSSIILTPLVLFLIILGSPMLDYFILLCFIITIYEWYKMITNKIYFIIGSIYLVFSFFSILKIRNDIENGFLYVLIVLLICISTDVGGYLFGKILKGPKLTKISPNKTYAGSCGSYIFSILVIKLIYSYEFFLLHNVNFEIKTIYFIIILSTTSQLGDITISYFKRLSKIKNTGNIIPGHGGLLDRIDGMIFAYPIAFILLNYNFFKIL
jgi:phosphatidate cytidylyltransferase